MVNKFVARMITVMRISIGDFDYNSSILLTPFQNTLYWITFLMMCVVTSVIFMNFIIAEVGATYQTVKEKIFVSLLQERGTMINEAEDILRARFGSRIQTWNHLFPKYIITRETDN